ncbi:MAG: YeeE/YedE family protein [Burkholderiaceae bacterium]|jgi:uncharacterized membrane protein YedE/YeeE|nr:YeeE/YedE family protein [Burkholderiaceae bacterium]MCU0963477.1 YeeE/YedE family protein [Burkholderiaceae bacterium]
MAANPLHLLWAAPVAFGAGWAAQRASLCNVRAAADWIEHRDGRMLGTLLRASLWATVATGAFWAAGVAAPALSAPLGLAGALLGGLLFGLGAAMNRGCSLSTLIRLAEGQWALLLTLAGFGLGAWLASRALPQTATGLFSRASSPLAWPGWATTGPWWLLLAAWGLYDARRCRSAIRQDPLHNAWWRRPAWPLQQVAWVFGLAGAAMYGAYGAWTYTNLLRLEATGQPVAAAGLQLVLVTAMVAGMGVAARRSGAWSLRGPESLGALGRHLLGGMMMGVGSMAIPGGNDSVLLAWLPALSVDGVAAYLGIVLGIAGPIVLHRGWRGVARPASDINTASTRNDQAHPWRARADRQDGPPPGGLLR